MKKAILVLAVMALILAGCYRGILSAAQRSGFDNKALTNYQVPSGQDVKEEVILVVFHDIYRINMLPGYLKVHEGDNVVLRMISDSRCIFVVDGYNINVEMEPQVTKLVSFKADKEGLFDYYCQLYTGYIYDRYVMEVE